MGIFFATARREAMLRCSFYGRGCGHACPVCEHRQARAAVCTGVQMLSAPADSVGSNFFLIFLIFLIFFYFCFFFFAIFFSF